MGQAMGAPEGADAKAICDRLDALIANTTRDAPPPPDGTVTLREPAVRRPPGEPHEFTEPAPRKRTRAGKPA